MSNEFDIQRLNVFLQLLSACAPVREMEGLLTVLTEYVPRIIDFERFTVLLCDDSRRIARTILIGNSVSLDVPTDEFGSADVNAIRDVLATGTASSGLTGMCSPMESAGHLVGALCFGRRALYTAEDVRFAQFLADYLAGTFDRLAQERLDSHMKAAAAAVPPETDLLADPVSWRVRYFIPHDVLTDLPSRLLLNDRLAHEMALNSRYGRRLAVLFLDLDRFKDINDSLGHSVGDQVLRTVADRLVRCVRSSDAVSRHGGDEFVVLLAQLERAEDAGISASNIMAAVTAPIHVDDHEIHITASIGISVYPGDGDDVETLIKNADTAMYYSKVRGRQGYQFFNEDMNARAAARRLVIDGMRRALDRHDFQLRYQPRVDLETGAIIGAEALIRWRHPERGLILPTQFLSIAEGSGLMVPIGLWILHEACRQAKAWQEAGLPRISVSVNISAAELRSNTFLKDVDRILKETGLEARYLELELTESVFVKTRESNKRLFQELKHMGVQLAIDDFGAGSSTFRYWTQLPIDVLKIDKSFVQQLIPDSNGELAVRATSMVGALIDIGKNLGLRVVAKGVETAEQRALLRRQQCGAGQGYYFSRPLVPERFAKVLENEKV